jgi:hypothetical protein
MVDSFTEYSNMPHAKPVKVRLLYSPFDGRVLGGELLGDMNPAGHVENLGNFILHGAKVVDLLVSHFSSHPELTPHPSHPYWPLAAQAAFAKMRGTAKH